MKLPIIKTNNTFRQQLSKINSEYKECLLEYNNYNFYKAQGFETSMIMFEKQMQMEALDILTASLNSVVMLNIPQSVIDEWIEKMKRYETEKGYVIEGWVEINE